MRSRQQKSRFIVSVLLTLLTICGIVVSIYAPLYIPFVSVGTHTPSSGHITLAARVASTNTSANSPTPFMHRPFYGNQTIGQRTVSFVDHDKPWYDNDGTFVRYDGKKWTNVAIGSCTGGVNCYDGHNGYDLNMWYEPVLSVAAGTVIRANWYSPLNHNSSLGIWAAVDHGNGYVTAYGHLSALTVSVGDRVGTQWQIGTSGTTGSSTGPHLHMATYYLPYWQATDPFGWTGNYPDPNVVPDNYLWVNNPGTDTTIPLLSSNGSAIYPGATLVDDGDTGWSSTGNWTRDTSNTDIKGTLHWTPTTSGSATATATWHPTLSADGYYEVGVFVDETHASSSWVPYVVYSADPNHPRTEVQHTVSVDESHVGAFQGPYSWEDTGPQWISLGTYYFSSSMNGRVFVSNATGENGLQIAADGVEFVPVSVQATPPPPVYSFAVTSDSTPSIMVPNSSTPITVTVKNTSNFSWNASGSNAVQLLYRWLDAQGQTVTTSSPIALPQSVDAGNALTLSVSMPTPAQMGTYTLQWDMVQGNTLFSEHGGQVHTDTIQLIPLTNNLSATYYFAEGYTGIGTSEMLALTNPLTAQTNITITYLYQGKAPMTRTYQLAAQSHSVLNINQEVGAKQVVSMIVQGDHPFMAERTMYTDKGGFVTGSDSVGSPTLNTDWYFADGNTNFGWTTLLAVLNPNNQSVTLNVNYLYTQQPQSATKGPSSSAYVVPAHSRATLVLNQSAPNQQFGMSIHASGAVVVERPAYLVKSTMRGGNSVVGATAPQKTWYFGSGNTAPGFTERLVLANPNIQETVAQISYQTSDGNVFTQNVTVPGLSRIEVNVNDAVNQTLHGTMVNADAPIIAERHDFFSLGSLVGSTEVLGSPATSTNWYISQGDTSLGHNESLALTNPGTTSTQIDVVYYGSTGTPIIKTYTLAATTRMTISLIDDVGINASVGILIYATNPIVVEQNMFFTLPDGATGGYASMAG